MKIQTAQIKFPELSLQTRDAHKLRGYFSELFREHSPLLNNHLEDGRFQYRYPLVQYKVIEKIPLLTGLEEGARLLTELFLKIKELKIDDTVYPVYQKNIENKIVDIGVDDDLHQYEFKTLWMSLNQENYKKYINADSKQQNQQLKNILIANILSFYKAFDLITDKKIMATLEVTEHSTKFKDKKMLGFKGKFSTNAILPNNIGIGKSVSRGFGSITDITNH
jgi:hypothetical protein